MILQLIYVADEAPLVLVAAEIESRLETQLFSSTLYLSVRLSLFLRRRILRTPEGRFTPRPTFFII